MRRSSCCWAKSWRASELIRMAYLLLALKWWPEHGGALMDASPADVWRGMDPPAEPSILSSSSSGISLSRRVYMLDPLSPLLQPRTTDTNNGRSFLVCPLCYNIWTSFIVCSAAQFTSAWRVKHRNGHAVIIDNLQESSAFWSLKYPANNGSHSHLRLGFEIVKGFQAVTSKWSSESALKIWRGLIFAISKKNESISAIFWREDLSIIRYTVLPVHSPWLQLCIISSYILFVFVNSRSSIHLRSYLSRSI